MNLAQVLHEQWAANATLNDLLDSSRAFTGKTFDPTPPFCAITRESQSPEWQANCQGCVDRVGVRFQLFHHNYAGGYAIAEAIKLLFNRADFDLSGTDKVLTMERAGDFEIQEDDGIWRWVLDFQCLVHLTAGV